jgi:hypothetical protein
MTAQVTTETHPKDLISGFTHSLDQGIAVSLSVNAALVYNHILYWLHFNAQKKDCEKIEGKIWMYETQEAISESMGYLSVDEVKKAMKLLLDSGLLIKANFNKNPFDKTNWYTVFDQEIISKKRNSKKSYESAVAHDRKSTTAPSDSAVAHDRTLYIQNKDTLEKQQQKTASAAVFSCLEQEDIPLDEKIWLSKIYDEETVQYAITWLHHPLTKISTTNIQALKWACKNKPDLPKSVEDLEQENKRFALQVQENTFKHPERTAYFEVLHKSIEIGYTASQSIPFVMEYTCNEFKTILISTLKKYGFITKETNTKGSG